MSSPIDLSDEQLVKINSGFVYGIKKYCKQICTPKFSEIDLNASEKNCVDRCVFKYYEANYYMSKFYREEKLSQQY